MTYRLKNIFALSIPLFIAHGLEEYVTGFYAIDSHVEFVFGWLAPTIPLQTSFLIFQLIFWTALVTAYFIIRSGRLVMPLLVILGLLYMYEIHHLIKTFQAGGYYPGLITAIALYCLGVLYWREFLASRLKWRAASKNI